MLSFADKFYLVAKEHAACWQHFAQHTLQEGKGGRPRQGVQHEADNMKTTGRDKEQQPAVEVTLRRRLVLRAFPA